jgi:hypothetical protein
MKLQNKEGEENQKNSYSRHAPDSSITTRIFVKERAKQMTEGFMQIDEISHSSAHKQITPAKRQKMEGEEDRKGTKLHN